MEELKFTLSRIEIPVEIDGEQYVLREASGETAATWRNAIMRCAVIGPDGKPTGVRDLADTELLLVSLCLFHVGSGNAVGLDFVRSLPNRVCRALFAKVREISDIDEETAGN